ncbi:hexameric tyrosine-coordinated heme protein [Sporosarcina cascadiensis]
MACKFTDGYSAKGGELAIKLARKGVTYTQTSSTVIFKMNVMYEIKVFS